MAAFSFDFNGTPVTINTPIGNLRWAKTPVYVGPTTLSNYILLVSFNDGTTDRSLEIRLFTDNIRDITYELANQGTLIESTDIALCNSMYMRMVNNNEVYNSDAPATVIVTLVNAAPPPPTCTGTFTGDLILYRDAPVINNSLPMLSNPAVADTINITNGVFTDIPII